MMIRLIRDDLGALPNMRGDPRVIVRGKNSLYYRVGAEIEVTAKGCFQLVNNGDAEPVDDEAKAAAGNWLARRPEVLLARDMLAKGIDPEDRERYRRGELLGYDADGNDIPGPNYIEPEPEETEEE